MSRPTVGQTLPNGALVLQARPTRGLEPADNVEHVVLALFNGSEFVTWIWGPSGGTFWGNYHQQDLAAALADFERRVAGG